MKNTVLFVFFSLFASLFGFSETGFAQAGGRTSCDLEFKVNGSDIQILLGRSKLTGAGTINCIDPQGARETLNVTVTMGTPVLFPRIAFAPSIALTGKATGISVLRGGAKTLLDEYLTVDVRGSIGRGAGATLSLLGENAGLSMNLVVYGVEGFGIAVGGTIVKIE